jgi:hypothetical protein
MTSVSQLNLAYNEAVWMWLTGSPPKRFMHSGKENINDVLEEIEIIKEAEEATALSKLSRRAKQALLTPLQKAGSKGLPGSKGVQDVPPAGQDV